MKSIVITGAASGIGKAVAELFHQDGWFVGLFDLAEAPLKELAQKFDGNRCHIETVSVTDAEQLATAFERFAQKAGKLDVLFNCAGLLEFGHFEDIGLKRHQQILQVNTEGLLNCCYQAFPYLKAASSARVINMSSQSSMFGIPSLSSYSATKSWVKSFTESLNIEWQRHDILVTDVAPPFVNTPMLSGGNVSGGQPQIMEKMGVDFTAEDIARQVKKALNSRKMHWRVGLEHKILYFLQSLSIDPVRRLVLKHMAGY